MRNQWFYKLLFMVALPALSATSMAQVAVVDNSTDGNTALNTGNDLAPPELTPPVPGTSTSTVNQAYINQASNTDVAYITQTGAGNYAAIYQSGHSGNVAIITQTGSNSYAVIRQN